MRINFDAASLATNLNHQQEMGHDTLAPDGPRKSSLDLV